MMCFCFGLLPAAPLACLAGTCGSLGFSAGRFLGVTSFLGAALAFFAGGSVAFLAAGPAGFTCSKGNQSHCSLAELEALLESRCYCCNQGEVPTSSFFSALAPSPVPM